MTTHTKVRVAIVEEHLMQRKHTEELVAMQTDLKLVFSGTSVAEMLHWARTVPRGARPQVVVLEPLPGGRRQVNLEAIRGLRDAGVRIVAITGVSSGQLARTIMREGARAVVSKRDTEESVVEALHAVVDGRTWMTATFADRIDNPPPKLSIQEERALTLYGSGMTVAAVASEMGISWETTRQYLDRVKKKYSDAGIPVRTKLDLGRIAVVDGYVQ